jgi:hypothetical protein
MPFSISAVIENDRKVARPAALQQTPSKRNLTVTFQLRELVEFRDASLPGYELGSR